jgi:excisionase family DNA binding protein
LLPTAVSILLFTESSGPSGIFLKKMPPRTLFRGHLHTRAEAAKALSISPYSVNALIASNQLPVVRVGRLVRVHDDALTAFSGFRDEFAEGKVWGSGSPGEFPGSTTDQELNCGSPALKGILSKFLERLNAKLRCLAFSTA